MRITLNYSLLVLLFSIAKASWALSGGQIDVPEQFKAVVAIIINDRLHCSATKIGTHAFLTAAHCVTDLHQGTLNTHLQAGQKLLISAHSQPPARPAVLQLTIQRIQLHPAYQTALHRFFEYRETQIRAYQQRYQGAELAQRLRMLAANHHFTTRFPDLAIIMVRDTTAQIPYFAVDCAPLAADAAVQIVGYGRTGAASAPFGQRHWGTTAVIRVDSVNFYTYGGQLRANTPSLTPGDSGGPVLRNGRVVGVNGTVYGLQRGAARSNMAVNINGLAAPSACRDFFRDVTP
ncbi:peptidase S1 [Chromatium okenii]|uniref:trypsin-like serine protease n=1 Tax=Chromatium okenii TaxID=61644 RepID=UPI0019083D66|nr:trypsin-like serine protease [Chromatium okenii]MBK1641637.1 peptidase S1 [Chromatium okenii]